MPGEEVINRSQSMPDLRQIYSPEQFGSSIAPPIERVPSEGQLSNGIMVTDLPPSYDAHNDLPSLPPPYHGDSPRLPPAYHTHSDLSQRMPPSYDQFADEAPPITSQARAVQHRTTIRTEQYNVAYRECFTWSIVGTVVDTACLLPLGVGLMCNGIVIPGIAVVAGFGVLGSICGGSGIYSGYRIMKRTNETMEID